MTRQLLRGSVAGAAGRLRQARIEIDGSRIAGVELGGVGDCESIIAPGFIDLQVNGFAGHDAAEGPGAIAAISEALPSTGVTSFLPTLISRPLAEGREFVSAASRAAAGAPGARVLGAHLEGPFLAAAHRGAHDATCLLTPTPARVAQVLACPPRLMTIAPELPGGMDAVRALACAGVLVSIGHTGATYEQARAAFDAGVRFATHLFNAMPRLHHRAPGAVGAILDDDRVTTGIVADNVHVHPSLVGIAGRAKGVNRIVLTTDQVAAAGAPPGRYLLGGREVRRVGDSARLENGTLAGSVATMDLLLRNVAGLFGLGHALPMTSRTPAAVLGLRSLGRIAPGCEADLVVLGPELCVRRTVVGGRTVYAA